MKFNLEEKVKARLKAAGNMPPNGVKTGSDLHLAEMLLAKNETLLEALKRANRIIDWMAPYLGGMCPPPNGIVDLNEHWLLMEQMVISVTPSKDGKPVNQSTVRTEPGLRRE